MDLKKLLDRQSRLFHNQVSKISSFENFIQKKSQPAKSKPTKSQQSPPKRQIANLVAVAQKPRTEYQKFDNLHQHYRNQKQLLQSVINQRQYQTQNYFKKIRQQREQLNSMSYFRNGDQRRNERVQDSRVNVRNMQSKVNERNQQSRVGLNNQRDKPVQKNSQFKTNFTSTKSRIIQSTTKSRLPTTNQEQQNERATHSQKGQLHNNKNQMSRSQRWNRQSQIGTMSRVNLSYQKHFADGENVFYEDSRDIKELEIINYCWRKVLVIFLVTLTPWLIIWSIKPYQGQCPLHASCGAYINCHKGYVLDKKKQYCMVDPQVQEMATSLMNSIVQDLKLQYGQKDCHIPENLTPQQIEQYKQPPKLSYNKIYQKVKINSDDFLVLQNQLYKKLNDKALRAIAQIQFDPMYYKFYPLEKKYSTSCKIDLFIKNNYKTYVGILVSIGLSVVYMMFWVAHRVEEKKALRIYQYLKQEVSARKEIRYMEYKKVIEEEFNNKRAIQKKLWQMINKYRIQQGVVGCYDNGHEITFSWLAAGTL